MYRREHYNVVLDAIIKQFGINQATVPDWQWTAWRVSIKRLFDNGYLIKEIVGAIEQAGEKRKWPIDRKLFTRIEDVILLRRREIEPITKIDTGPQSLRNLLPPSLRSHAQARTRHISDGEGAKRGESTNQ